MAGYGMIRYEMRYAGRNLKSAMMWWKISQTEFNLSTTYLLM